MATDDQCIVIGVGITMVGPGGQVAGMGDRVMPSAAGPAGPSIVLDPEWPPFRCIFAGAGMGPGYRSSGFSGGNRIIIRPRVGLRGERR